jgi:ribonuclease P protein component
LVSSDNSNRFPRNSRLLDATAFGRVFEQASRSRDKLFTVLCRSNDQGLARLGMAISKKNCRRATMRNTIKRTIRESFRHNPRLLSGLDIVVLNQPAATRADTQEMTTSLAAHWQRCSKAAQKNRRQEK